MARRKAKKTEEVDTTQEVVEEVEAVEAAKEVEEVVEAAEAEVEVTEEFILQDVSDTTDSYQEIVDEQLVDLDKTEVEAAIEKGEIKELVESSKPTDPKQPDLRVNRTTVDTPVSATNILKELKEKREDERSAFNRKILAKVKPVKSDTQKNNGIRTSTGLFNR